MSTPNSLESARSRFESDWPQYLAELETLVRIPSVSFDGFDPAEVKRSASAVQALLKRVGMERVEILEFPGAHPYVVGEWMGAGPSAPTLLLYAHHDVQPPGRTEAWLSPPFEPTRREGPGGMRMYARGAADDKAGVIVHAAAIGSYLKSGGKLPVNVKIVVEGEEEIGSDHLADFLKAHREKLQADVMVLTDTTNFDCGVPALTVALRGLVAVEFELRALKGAVHSGMWGGPIPDAAQALAKVLATLTDADGAIAVPGAMDEFIPPSSAELLSMAEVKVSEADFRKQSGVVPGAKLRHEGPSLAAQTWRYPSLTVCGIQASSRAQAGNILCDTAWSKVTIRLARGMKGAAVLRALKTHLQAQVPWGLELHWVSESVGDPWFCEPVGPAFEAAERALERGYGRKPLKIGCGGSIPFVQPFSDALGGAPALLVGVEDPYTNAHGENESLLISDLKKACASQIELFWELRNFKS